MCWRIGQENDANPPVFFNYEVPRLGGFWAMMRSVDQRTMGWLQTHSPVCSIIYSPAYPNHSVPSSYFLSFSHTFETTVHCRILTKRITYIELRKKRKKKKRKLYFMVWIIIILVMIMLNQQLHHLMLMHTCINGTEQLEYGSYRALKISGISSRRSTSPISLLWRQ